jgi:hypothetical protein
LEAQESDDEDSFRYIGGRKDNEEEETTLEGYRGGGGGVGVYNINMRVRYSLFKNPSFHMPD